MINPLNSINVLFKTSKDEIIRYNKFDLNIILIVLYVAFTCFSGLGDTFSQNFTAHDEGIYVGRAKLILEQNNWFTPFTEPHHKTIGSYWLIALFIKLFGFSEFTARLPSSIFSICSAVLVYCIAREFLSVKSSLFASLTLPSMPLWIQYSRYASPDILFVFITLAINYCIYKYSIATKINFQTSYIYSLYVGLFIGLAFFLRSFMIAIPIIALIPFIYSIKKYINSKTIRYLIIGIICGSIPSIISIICALYQFGPESLYTLFDFARNKALGGNFFKSTLFYPINIFALSFPFCLVIVPGLTFIFRKKRSQFKYLFIYYPVIVITLLSLMSSRYSHYTLLIYPTIAILCGHTYEALNSCIIKTNHTIYKLIGIVFILLATFIICAYIAANLGMKFNFTSQLSNYYHGILPLSVIYLVCGIILTITYIDYKKILYSILLISLVQSISLTNLYARGEMGNPNLDFKRFITDPSLSEYITTNTVYLMNIHGKIRTLFQCYLPKYPKHIESLSSLKPPAIVVLEEEEIYKYISNYIIETKASFKNLKLVTIE